MKKNNQSSLTFFNQFLSLSLLNIKSLFIYADTLKQKDDAFPRVTGAEVLKDAERKFSKVRFELITCIYM